MLPYQATVEQLITSLDNKLKKFKEGSKIDTNRRILDQFDQLREYYKVTSFSITTNNII